MAAKRYHMRKLTRYFIGSSEFRDKADAIAHAKAYANKDGRTTKVTIETREAGGFERLLSQSSFTVPPSKRNPPAGFIPCNAVKITRNRGKVEVRIRK
jgi:hypothetical protein